MDNSESKQKAAVKFATLAAVVALFGIADAAYLTAKHFANEQVPCSLITGCEQVLTSSYAEIFGIPTATLGLIAYFAAFSLALLTAFGNEKLWSLFGILVSLMAVFTIWLIYLQAFVIGAFCQFCLISAGITFTLFTIYWVSKFFSKNR